MKGASTVEKPPGGGASGEVSPRTVPSSEKVTAKRLSHRLLIDKIARRLVTVGGIAIIFSILAIFFVIILEVVPLFLPPSITQLKTLVPKTAALPFAGGVDRYQRVAFSLTQSGQIRFTSLISGAQLESVKLNPNQPIQVTAVTSAGKNRYAAGTSIGQVIPFQIQYPVEYVDDERIISAKAIIDEPIHFDRTQNQPVRDLAYSISDTGPVWVVLMESGALNLFAEEESESLLGPSESVEIRSILPSGTTEKITAMAIDGVEQDLYVGTSDGQIIRYDISDRSDPKLGGAVYTTENSKTGITTLSFLLGDQTLVVGDERGRVSTWHVVTEPGTTDRRLVKVYDYFPHQGPVTLLQKALRNKGFMTADSSGRIQIHYGTSGKTSLTFQSDATPLQTMALAPKGNGLLTLNDQGALTHYEVDNPHPEISLDVLFGKVWYEGYPQPEYVWQSTGGTDEFESKFSLTPLVFGTLKGTFYAMLFAIPLALLSALYTSQFMHRDLRGKIKPTIEFMAALPSVVLGFIAGLWLAPILEGILPGILLLPIVLSVLILVFMSLLRQLPERFKMFVKPGFEILILVPVVLLGTWLSIRLGYALEEFLLAEDYRIWIRKALGLTFDQRNSIVVGIAMGFAVIPIIYTIAEDSLSSVPPHLSAGSMALGASPWQTAIRVVLPTASPGIFSAVMIGFGRAVGETMIVLMATGNTPIMDFSPFNGLRALSANIAVELPEAPVDGTLFRILFLAALMLFVMTFVVNTIAEVVRLRLRKKYRSI